MTNEKATKIKNFLQSTGAFAGAVSGVAMGLLALMRVFYPDPKQTTTTGTTGVTEVGK